MTKPETARSRCAPAARTDGDAARRHHAEHALIATYLPIATNIARRYRRRGVETDDLEQVARLGLVKAIRGWQPDRGGLLGYLVPTVDGEIKRYFRDAGTAIRIPRSLYEAQPKVAATERLLRQRFAREPTAAEVAAVADLPIARVREVRRAADVCRTISTDDDAWAPDSPSASAERDLANASLRTMLRPAMASLTARERRVVALRFVWGQSQREIAAAVGVSQMHVSRLLRASLAKLRAALPGLEPGALPAA